MSVETFIKKNVYTVVFYFPRAVYNLFIPNTTVVFGFMVFTRPNLNTNLTKMFKLTNKGSHSLARPGLDWAERLRLTAEVDPHWENNARTSVAENNMARDSTG